MRELITKYTNSEGTALTIEADGEQLTIRIGDGPSWTTTASSIGQSTGERQVAAIATDLNAWVSEAGNRRYASKKGVA